MKILFNIFRKLGLDLVPRLGSLAVSPTEIGIVALHNVHMRSDETAKNTSVRAFSNVVRACVDVFIRFRVEERCAERHRRKSSTIIST